MKRLLNFFLKGIIPLFFIGWCFYFTGKSIYEYIYYKRLASRIKREILYIKARTAVREARIDFLQTEKGRRVFVEKMKEDLSRNN